MITFWIFALVISVVALNTLIGTITVPLQGALIVDATGHSVLFGIALAFLIVENVQSPLLFVGAVLSVFIMHICTKFLKGKNLLAQDAALGVSFSFLFACGILIITLYARNIHLDLDMILIGNIEYALYENLVINARSYGPFMFWLSSGLLIILSALLMLFWRPFTALLFDKQYASLKGYFLGTMKGVLIIITSYSMVASLNVSGALILTGITAAPLGMWWNYAQGYGSFLFLSMLSMLILAITGTGCALIFDLPIAATVVFVIVFYTIIHAFFMRSQNFLFQKKNHVSLIILRDIIEQEYTSNQFFPENRLLKIAQNTSVDVKIIRATLTSFLKTKIV